MKAILLDIEGTTTTIDFVHKTLFPFSKARMGEYVREHFDELKDEIGLLAEECLKESDFSAPLNIDAPESVSSYLEHLIGQDRKSTPLKSIQGKIWQQGYESGELKSVLFDDVPAAFEKWTTAGKTIAIYSSGSVLAQQQLFRHTNHGDLTPFISGYFDTNIGGKREPDSYLRIADDLGIGSTKILFVSDIVSELDAARGAGMTTALSIRPGNGEITEDTIHQIVTSFADLAV